MKEVNLFEGPIPGQSLTDAPKNSPWESPPEMNELEEVVTYYIEKLSKPEVLDDLALVFEMGGNVEDITETMVMMGTMKGVHTVDIQMLATPMVGAYIKAAMTYYDMDVPMNVLEGSDVDTEREKMRMKKVFEDAIEKSKTKGADEGTELLQEMSEAVDEMPEEGAAETETPMEAPEVEAPTGLMSKETM